MSRKLKSLPQGLQVFSDLITGGDVYVDKTELIHKIVQKPKRCYFLSRPRRFGKSLLVSTLEALFQGKKELFEGLWIADSDYSWKPSPVIRLDFSGFNTSSPRELSDDLSWHIQDVAEVIGVSLNSGLSPSQCLTRLVRHLVKEGQPVLLVDEYDAPLVTQLHDPELTHANRAELAKFFATFKKLQSEVHFSLITGVSQFARVSLFSGLNNLQDISFADEYSTLMGFTEEEIRSTFSGHLEQLSEKKSLSVDVIIDEMREWYNGYQFAEELEGPRVYNPWSVIQFLASGKFKNYWFASATPTFAIKKIRQRNWTLSDLQSTSISYSDLKDSWDPDRIGLVPLLYQTGYLTIDRVNTAQNALSLRIPNKEVEESLTSHLLADYVETEPDEFQKIRETLRSGLSDRNMDRFFQGFNTILADISSRLHIPQERFYHSLLHMCLVALGLRVETEVETSRGRIDLVLHLPDSVFVFELKIDRSAAHALKQIKETGYAEKYRLKDKPIYLIGVRCSSKSRSVEEWKQDLVPAADSEA